MAQAHQLYNRRQVPVPVSRPCQLWPTPHKHILCSPMVRRSVLLHMLGNSTYNRHLHDRDRQSATRRVHLQRTLSATNRFQGSGTVPEHL